jgi:hypothetical protein
MFVLYKNLIFHNKIFAVQKKKTLYINNKKNHSSKRRKDKSTWQKNKIEKDKSMITTCQFHLPLGIESFTKLPCFLGILWKEWYLSLLMFALSRHKDRPPIVTKDNIFLKDEQKWTVPKTKIRFYFVFLTRYLVGILWL